jgi:flagellar basal body-associated protein FliL
MDAALLIIIVPIFLAIVFVAAVICLMRKKVKQEQQTEISMEESENHVSYSKDTRKVIASSDASGDAPSPGVRTPWNG